MPYSLLASLLCLALWIVFVFLRPFGLGIVHILLGLAGVLWVRWWGSKEPKRNSVQ